MNTNQNDIIIRFTDVASQPKQAPDGGSNVPIKRLIGFVPASNILPLIDAEDLTANPRSSRRNGVVEDILDTLNTSPELFHFKSKGILIGTSDYDELQRNRYRLRFPQRDIEGVLDGGHNMLGIGLHMLQRRMDVKEWKRIKLWDDMKAAWANYRDDIEDMKDEFDFLVPVELLVPTGSSEDDLDAFLMPLLKVCEARNNNAQLTREAKSNKQGFYDAIKHGVSDDLKARVEWQPNHWDDGDEKHPIKVRDLVALAWIPLNLLHKEGCLPGDISVPPQNIYCNKGDCSKRFEELMSQDEVTKPLAGSKRELHHEGVISAFEMLDLLTELYDKIYEGFPAAYNIKNKRRFGSHGIVKIYDPKLRKEKKDAGKDISGYVFSEPKSPFYREGSRHSYPDGLIIPLIYGLQGLMVVDDGKVRWAVDVSDVADLVKRNLRRVADTHHLVMDLARWDPQKISKNPSGYELAVREFRSALNDERHNVA